MLPDVLFFPFSIHWPWSAMILPYVLVALVEKKRKPACIICMSSDRDISFFPLKQHSALFFLVTQGVKY